MTPSAPRKFRTMMPGSVAGGKKLAGRCGGTFQRSTEVVNGSTSNVERFHSIYSAPGHQSPGWIFKLGRRMFGVGWLRAREFGAVKPSSVDVRKGALMTGARRCR